MVLSSRQNNYCCEKADQGDSDLVKSQLKVIKKLRPQPIIASRQIQKVIKQFPISPHWKSTPIFVNSFYSNCFIIRIKTLFELLHYSNCFIIRIASLFELKHYSNCFIIRIKTLFELLHYSNCFVIRIKTLFELLYFSNCFNIRIASLFQLLYHSNCFIIRMTSLFELLHYSNCFIIQIASLFESLPSCTGLFLGLIPPISRTSSSRQSPAQWLS